jgi:hypothetical protein
VSLNSLIDDLRRPEDPYASARRARRLARYKHEAVKAAVLFAIVGVAWAFLWLVLR